MNVYEFTQALWRQKWVLLVGGILIAAAIFMVGFEFDGGVRLRAQPKYESTIQMAVVPADLETLTGTISDSGGMAGTASLYGTLLASPQASLEIEQASGVQLLDFSVQASGRDRFIFVTATAEEYSGATTAALQSYTWLQERLTDPLAIARIGGDPTPQSILDEEGRFTGSLRLDVSPAFADGATGLWLSVQTAPDSEVTASLADAALTLDSSYRASLEPGGEMLLVLEDVFGNEIDVVPYTLPPLPGTDTIPYDLLIRIDRGALLDPTSTAASTGEDGEAASTGPAGLADPELVAERIDVVWEPVASSGGENAQVSSPVGLLLLTEDPVAFSTGSRRGPIILLGGLFVAFFALVVLAVTVDSWTQARRQGKAEAEAETSEVDAPPAPEPLEVAELPDLDEYRSTGAK